MKKQSNPFRFYSLIICPSKSIITMTISITIAITTMWVRMRTRKWKRDRRKRRNPVVFCSLIVCLTK